MEQTFLTLPVFDGAIQVAAGVSFYLFWVMVGRVALDSARQPFSIGPRGRTPSRVLPVASGLYDAVCPLLPAPVRFVTVPIHRKHGHIIRLFGTVCKGVDLFLNIG